MSRNDYVGDMLKVLIRATDADGVYGESSASEVLEPKLKTNDTSP